MDITTAQVKEIRQELAKLKPVKVTLDGTRRLTVKEAVFALAPDPGAHEKTRLRCPGDCRKTP